MEANYTVYSHTCRANGKRYVGLTKLKPETRWNNGKGYAKNKAFYADIEKYGWDGFDHEILATELTRTEAQDTERYYIEQFDTIETGYNQEDGGKAPEPTFLSPTLTRFRIQAKRSKFYNRHPVVLDLFDALTSADKDKATAAVWNEMGKNAMSNTMMWWHTPQWDDEIFLSEFIANMQEEIKVIEWILGGCKGDSPIYISPAQKRHYALYGRTH